MKMAPIFLKAVGFSRALSVYLSFFPSFSLTAGQPQSSNVSTSTINNISTINTTLTTTTTTTPQTPMVPTSTPHPSAHRETPQRYVFSFPAVKFGNDGYEQSLVIATTRPHNVTVDLVTTYMLLSANGSYVINNNSAPLTLVLAQNGITSVRSVEITSSDVVNVYAFDYFTYHTHNIDAILVHDVTQLGKRYSVMTLPFTRQRDYRRSFFVVTASEDNTTVVIRKPVGVDVDLPFTSPSSQLTVDGRIVTTTLNKLQTVSTIHDGDLTGLDIRSDKPLALSFGLNRNSMEGGCCYDHMWVQLPGVHVWGKEYVTFPTTAMGPSSTDVYYLAAAENDTVVYVDCDNRLTLRDAYEWTSTTLDTASFHYLVSDKPFVVIKSVRGNRNAIDPYMLTLTDTSRWTTAMTFALPTNALWDSASLTFTVTIITEEAKTDSLTINGEHLQANWRSISAEKGSNRRALVGGELTGLSRGVVHVLSSVSGTTRMAAYVTGASKYHGLCYALGGDAPETDGWNPIFTCPETTTYALTTIMTTTENTITTQGFTSTATDTTPTIKTTTENTVTTQGFTSTATDTTFTTSAASTATDITPTIVTTTENTVTSQGFTSTATNTTSTTLAASAAPITPTTTKPSHPPKPAQRIQPCYCKQNTPRSSTPKTPAQEKEEEAAVVAVLEELKANLTVARGNTSASVRKVSSAPDERSSSFAMGAFAIVSLSLVLAVVLSFDCIRVVQWVHAKKTASRSLKQQSA